MEKQTAALIEIGKIIGTHGIKGEVKVEPWCDSADLLYDFDRLYTSEDGSSFVVVVSCRMHKSHALLTLKGIDTIDKATPMIGTIFYVERADFVLDDGVYFIQDILGCTVYDIDTGVEYGKVTDVMKTGANNVYQITNTNKKNCMIPVIPDVVIRVDISDKSIFIRPLRGLFDDED